MSESLQNPTPDTKHAAASGLPAGFSTSSNPAYGNVLLSDEQMRTLGVLHEDVNDLFRLTQRSTTLIIMHALKTSHADAARIMEHWWHNCRKKYKTSVEKQ